MKLLTCAIVAAACLAGSAQAATLTPGAGWSSIFFSQLGGPIEDFNTGDTSWDFTLTSAAYLDVTDAFTIGDAFEIYNGATLLGSTGPFNVSGPETSDPDVAFGGPDYSWGRFLLAPGTYSINGILTAACCEAGSGYIRLAEAGGVPEPDSWALMIAGFGLVGAAMRRRSVVTIAA
jgi:opacity protein-like surface antigen